MTTLSIGIDGRPLVGSRTGIGVHTAEIAGRLRLDPPPLILSHAEIGDRSGIEHCRFRTDRSPLGVLWQQSRLARILDSEQVDVFWGPHGTLPLGVRVPSVVTVHDLTSITMPGRHRIRTVLSFNVFIGRSLELASTVVAVSHCTAEEIRRGFGVPPSKIEVVPNGVDPFFTPGANAGALPPELEPGSYILYAGTLEPRKGIVELLDAWEHLGPRKPRLVLAGDTGWKTSRLISRARDRNGSMLMILGFVSRERLRELYRQALMLVYPSHFEGFGLPPLEAMACGTAVIAARAGAIPEVTGDAALLVPAGDATELERSMRLLLRDVPLRDAMIARGQERAALYDWNRSAETMLEILRAAAGD